jgi:II/X family phage/plasmid replication protein
MMIDKLTLRCSFLRSKVVKNLDLVAFVENVTFKPLDWDYPKDFLIDLGIPLQVSIDRDGNVGDLRHAWESLPSSYSQMAFKIFDHRFDKRDAFFIEITASPAKLMLGHNLYGSSNVVACACYMIWLLRSAYPQLFEWLDMTTWFVATTDLTYFSRADNQAAAVSFINALHKVSYGQTKSRTGYDGTAYFGKKNSRLKKIKIYSKFQESENQIKLGCEFISKDLLAWSSSMIRFETSLYHRYFERKNLSCDLFSLFNWLTVDSCIDYWKGAAADLFKALEGSGVVLKEENVHQLLRDKFFKVLAKTGNVSYAAADAAFRTYRFIKVDGWEVVFNSMPRRTFYHHVSMLAQCGISRADLQNSVGTGNVVPFTRYIGVDFDKQFPDGVTEEKIIKPFAFQIKQIENLLKTHVAQETG